MQFIKGVHCRGTFQTKFANFGFGGSGWKKIWENRNWSHKNM